MKKLISIFIAAIILCGIMIWKTTFRLSDSSLESKKADIEIVASDLIKDFEADENQANTLYLDKILAVKGAIFEIKNDSAGKSIYLKDSLNYSGVLCGFNLETEIPSELAVGDTVSIKGMCSGYLMDVLLNKCSVEE